MSGMQVALSGAHRLGALAHLLENNEIDPNTIITFLEASLGTNRTEKYKPSKGEKYHYPHPDFKTFEDFKKHDSWHVPQSTAKPQMASPRLGALTKVAAPRNEQLLEKLEVLGQGL
jgi:hypothetical protein